jgi:toxin ParE1/3/4
MNFKVQWTEPAICDLERLDRYIARRNPAAAQRTGEALLRKAALLARFPELGPVWEEDPGWRFIVVKPYKMFYRILTDEKIVEISHIRHGAQVSPTQDDLLTD